MTVRKQQRRAVDDLIEEIQAEAKRAAPHLGKSAIDPRVLDAVRAVPRDHFVSGAFRDEAFMDRALPIGHGQTISAPFVVAAMTDALNLRPSDRVLEIGTGSGYQTAVLAELVSKVYSIERVAGLAEGAKARLRELRYENVEIRVGDGRLGWPEQAPFDAIMLTACAKEIPTTLKDQLVVGGRLIAPVGVLFDQRLTLIERTSKEERTRRRLFPVAFVPLEAAAE